MDEFWSVQTWIKDITPSGGWWRTEESDIETNDEAELVAKEYLRRHKKVRIQYHEKHVIWESK